jgi:hypothetical protein
VSSLAVFRAARMVAEEDGPAFVFKRLRDHFDDARSSISLGVRCFYCLSWWIALPAALLLIVVEGWNAWLLPLWWFGIGGLAVKLYEYWNVKK